MSSNVSSEQCNINDVDLNNYILVHYWEIKGKHEGGRYVDGTRIPEVLQEYKKELAQGNIPVLGRIQEDT